MTMTMGNTGTQGVQENDNDKSENLNSPIVHTQ